MNITNLQVYDKLTEIHKAITHANYEDALELTVKLMEQCFDTEIKE